MGHLLPHHRSRGHCRRVVFRGATLCCIFASLCWIYRLWFAVTAAISGQLLKYFLLPEEKDDVFRVSVAKFSRESLLDSCKVLVCNFFLIRKIVDLVTQGCSGHFVEVCRRFADPKTCENSSFLWVTEAFLGKTSAQVEILQLLKSLVCLEHMSLLYSVCATQDDQTNQWSDSRVQAVVAGPLQKFLGLSFRLLLPVFPPPDLLEVSTDCSRGTGRSTRRHCRPLTARPLSQS